MADPRLLRVRGVDARSRRQSQRELPDVADDGDDFNLQRPAAIERQALADWVLRAEVSARQGGIDGDDRRGAVDVAPIERSSGDQRDAERAEIIGADHAELGKRRVAAGRRRAERNTRPESARGKPVHDRRGLDSGEQPSLARPRGRRGLRARVPQGIVPAGPRVRVVKTCAVSKPGFVSWSA